MEKLQDQFVCVVDDDAAVRDSLRVLLESHGLVVRDYASASEFLKDTTSELAGCLLLDLHMPEMDGLHLLEKLRQQNITTVTVIITGRGDGALRARAQRAGALAFLDKPVDEDELLSTIALAFRQSRH
ncbi:MAG: response regulator [Parvibaculum sp.]|nr:response regulator [Parvibaculum sp.]